MKLFIQENTFSNHYVHDRHMSGPEKDKLLYSIIPLTLTVYMTCHAWIIWPFTRPRTFWILKIKHAWEGHVRILLYNNAWDKQTIHAMDHSIWYSCETFKGKIYIALGICTKYNHHLDPLCVEWSKHSILTSSKYWSWTLFRTTRHFVCKCHRVGVSLIYTFLSVIVIVFQIETYDWTCRTSQTVWILSMTNCNDTWSILPFFCLCCHSTRSAISSILLCDLLVD